MDQGLHWQLVILDFVQLPRFNPASTARFTLRLVLNYTLCSAQSLDSTTTDCVLGSLFRISPIIGNEPEAIADTHHLCLPPIVQYIAVIGRTPALRSNVEILWKELRYGTEVRRLIRSGLRK